VPSSPTSTNSHPNDQQVSTLGVFGLFVAGVLVVLLIGYLIMRDARQSTRRKGKRKAKAGAAPSPATAGSGRRPPPRRPSAAARKRRRRQKRRAR
jgi:hypothetical protein